MGLDIRKPIGLLFAVIAAELLAFEALKLVGGAAGGTSTINTWCALAFAAFGAGMLWLSR
jgi:hypothetical protein